MGGAPSRRAGALGWGGGLLSNSEGMKAHLKGQLTSILSFFFQTWHLEESLVRYIAKLLLEI